MCIRDSPSPVVTVNRAVAVGLASGPSAGLALLDGVELPNYQPLWAARAELLRLAGDLGAAGEAYARAIELSGNAAERAALERRRNGAG